MQTSENLPSTHSGELPALGGSLEPPTVLEDQIQRHRDHNHEHHRKWVAKRPVQLRHVVKVHAVDGPYEGWSEQDRGPGADLLYLVVLGYARSGEVHAQDILQQLAEALHSLGDPQRSVLHDMQVLLQLSVHLGGLATAYKAIEDIRQRLRSPLELDHFARQFVYAPRDARVAREDLGLYLVYVVLQARHHGSVAVNQPLDNRVEDRLRPPPEQLRFSLQAFPHRSQGRGLAPEHHHHKVLPHEDIDLAELHRLSLIEVASGLQDQKECALVVLELGAQRGLDRVLYGQRMQPELPGHGAELLLGGFVECDPSHPASLANALVRSLQRPRLLGPASVHVDNIVHDHGLIIRLSGRRLGPRNVGKRSGAELLFAFRDHASWAVRGGDSTGPVVATFSVSADADCDKGTMLRSTCGSHLAARRKS